MEYGWIELVVVGALALGFGGWQLWSVNREIARDRAARRSARPPGHAEGEHPLDDR
jgi:hypothetical protein